MWIGLNPSTADDTLDDPTIRRCMGFTKRWGYLTMCMTNLFAYRATLPKDMKCQPYPIGQDNDQWLAATARDAALIIACWGTHGQHMARDAEVWKLLDGIKCLRLTKDGHPEHPLYLPYTLTPIPYEPKDF